MLKNHPNQQRHLWRIHEWKIQRKIFFLMVYFTCGHIFITCGHCISTSLIIYPDNYNWYIYNCEFNFKWYRWCNMSNITLLWHIHVKLKMKLWPIVRAYICKTHLGWIVSKRNWNYIYGADIQCDALTIITLFINEMIISCYHQFFFENWASKVGGCPQVKRTMHETFNHHFDIM